MDIKCVWMVVPCCCVIFIPVMMHTQPVCTCKHLYIHIGKTESVEICWCACMFTEGVHHECAQTFIATINQMEEGIIVKD